MVFIVATMVVIVPPIVFIVPAMVLFVGGVWAIMAENADLFGVRAAVAAAEIAIMTNFPSVTKVTRARRRWWTLPVCVGLVNGIDTTSREHIAARAARVITMSVLPENKTDLLEFCEVHAPVWAANAAGLGLSPAACASFTAATDEARLN
ncbi:MAG: hypothetical protein ACOVP8_07955, partial [Phycisphaerales bacterium]